MKEKQIKEEWMTTWMRVLTTLYFPISLMILGSLNTKYWLVCYIIAFLLLFIGERLK